jgi:SAM-dependent methyltransferase
MFDLGCGDGATANPLSELRYEVTGIDLSESDIALAHKSFPHLKLHIGKTWHSPFVGKWDNHSTLGGRPYKVFSIKTLGALLAGVGFNDVHFVRIGHIPPLSKSMIVHWAEMTAPHST